MKNKYLIAYSYIRFSHPKQAEGDSQRRQRQAALSWCERNNVPLDESLTLLDFGVSAFRGKHRTKGALAVFLNGVKAGRIKPGSVLIVENLDRLSREEVDEHLMLFLEIIRAGVVVVTLVPVEVVFDRDAISGNPMALMIALMTMARAHEESAVKSQRVAAAWMKKRANAGNEKLSAKCPGWLRLNKDTGCFDKNEKARTVLRIVKMALGGLGPVAIAATLNREKIPTLTVRVKNPSRTWEFSTIKYLLTSRTLLGEYQPKKFVEDVTIAPDGSKVRERRLVNAGDAIKGYYPALIDEAEFYRLQAVLDSRKRGTRGRTGRNVANLFGRCLVSGENGSTMRLAQKRAGRINLVSAAAVRGLAAYNSFPYEEFEWHFLSWVKELRLSEAPAAGSFIADELAGRLAEVDAKLAKAKAKAQVASAASLDDLLEMVASFGAERKRLAAELESARANRYRPSMQVAVEGIEGIVARLAELAGDDLRTAREQLRSQIQRLCPKISLWVWGTTAERTAVCAVEFQNGSRRLFAVQVRRGADVVSAGTPEPVHAPRWEFRQLARKAVDLLALKGDGRRTATPFDRKGVTSVKVTRV